jgi:hypothetical protein
MGTAIGRIVVPDIAGGQRILMLLMLTPPGWFGQVWTVFLGMGVLGCHCPTDWSSTALHCT